jgi:hypothetical protein
MARHAFCFIRPSTDLTMVRDTLLMQRPLFRVGFCRPRHIYKERIMAVLALATPVLMAAAGYSLLYLLMGGGLGGAILIFIVAKMLGK